MTAEDVEALSPLVQQGHCQLYADEQVVLRGIAQGQPIARDANEREHDSASLGDKTADREAAIGGSLGFIIGFSVIFLVWMLLNNNVLAHWGMAFDPYPYTFLNLMLSTLATIQAPVIMMRHNRQSEEDRVAATLDYQVNLRAELEILGIQEQLEADITAKIDKILAHLPENCG